MDYARRSVLAFPFLAGLAACAPQIMAGEGATLGDDAQLADIEQRIGGRLGAALVASDGRLLAGHRANEKFAMCSTFKAPLAAALIAAHNRGEIDQNAQFLVTENDLVPYAPYAERLVREKRMTSLIDLAEKAVDYSDNAAANIILRALGGPAALTAFFQQHGGKQTRLDRFEPEMNENAIGDPRDTTTPLSMASMIHHLLIKRSAGEQAGNVLRTWMIASATGKDRIEAGLPTGWTMGDKTGTAPSSAPAYNDVAIIWPQSSDGVEAKPVILAVYLDRPNVDGTAASAAISDIAKMLTPIMRATL